MRPVLVSTFGRKIEGPIKEELSYLNADEFPAVFAVDSGLDDLGVRDEHV